MRSELVFIVDEDNRPLAPQPRNVMIAKQLWCRSSSVAVVDLKNRKVLCQRRSDNKDERSGLWITEFGGKAEPGEEGIITAQRELKEEAGIQVPLDTLVFFELEKSNKQRQFASYYYLDCNAKTTVITPDPEEVAEVAWLSIYEAIEHLNHDPKWYSYGADIRLLQSLL